MHRLGGLVRDRALRPLEQRRDDLLERRFGIGLIFADHTHDHAGFLRVAAENRRLGVLLVQVVQDRQRFEYHIIIIAQHGQTAAEIHGQHLR